jgi:hypothetical protein
VVTGVPATVPCIGPKLEEIEPSAGLSATAVLQMKESTLFDGSMIS